MIIITGTHVLLISGLQVWLSYASFEAAPLPSEQDGEEEGGTRAEQEEEEEVRAAEGIVATIACMFLYVLRATAILQGVWSWSRLILGACMPGHVLAFWNT